MLVILPGVMDVSLAQTSWAMVFESEHIRILRKKVPGGYYQYKHTIMSINILKDILHPNKIYYRWHVGYGVRK